MRAKRPTPAQPEPAETQRENVRFPADWGAAIDKLRGTKSRAEWIVDMIHVRLLDSGAANLSPRLRRGRPPQPKHDTATA